MIDFDNPKTFPKELKNWGTEFEKMVLRRVNTANIEEWWQIEHQLQDIRIGESQLVTDFVKEKIFKFIVELTDEYKRIYEIGNRYPDVALTIVMSAFSMALYENSKEVKLKHFYKAVCRTKAVYDDAKVKEIARFKEIFKDIILEEHIDLNDM